MTLPTYEHLDDNRYRAWWGDVFLDVEESRERGWPGLGSADGEPDAELYDHAATVFRRTLGAPHPPRILDAGCGSGAGVARLRGAGVECVGIDVDARAVAFARLTYGARGYRRRGEEEEGFIAESLVNMSAPVFDGCTCVEAIEHIEDDKAAARALHACLRPGGVLYLTTPEGHPKRAMSPYHVREYTERELRDLLAGAGFTDLERHKLHTHMESLIFTARKP